MQAASLRIDTSVAGIAGPSSHYKSAQATGSASSDVRAHSSRRLRSASSASVSSTSSSPSQALHSAIRTRNGNLAPASPLDEDEDDSEYVLAMHDFEPQEPNETCLAFKAGQVIRLFNRDPSGWWEGEVDLRRGWFPSNYVTSEVGLLTEAQLPHLLVS
jgi:son of sevenless